MNTWITRLNLVALCIIVPVFSFGGISLLARLVLLFAVAVINLILFIFSILHQKPSIECALIVIVLFSMLALYLVNRTLGIL